MDSDKGDSDTQKSKKSKKTLKTFFFISKIYRKGAKGRNPKYTGCIQGTPKEQGKENNCLRNQNRNKHE
jgi:hypothetical protein